MTSGGPTTPPLTPRDLAESILREQEDRRRAAPGPWRSDDDPEWSGRGGRPQPEQRARARAVDVLLVAAGRGDVQVGIVRPTEAGARDLAGREPYAGQLASIGRVPHQPAAAPTG